MHHHERVYFLSTEDSDCLFDNITSALNVCPSPFVLHAFTTMLLLVMLLTTNVSMLWSLTTLRLTLTPIVTQ